MKNLRIIFLVLFCLFTGAILTDLHLLRGFYLGKYFFIMDYTGVNDKFDYIITKNEYGTFDVELRNKTLKYYPIIAYRYGPFVNDLNATIFTYASRYELVTNDSVLFDTGGGFDCGTDLDVVLIRPFETFRLSDVKPTELFSANEYLYHLVNTNDQRWEIPSNIPADIGIRLYLPVATLHEVDRRVYSNYFTISSEALAEKMRALKKLYL